MRIVKEVLICHLRLSSVNEVLICFMCCACSCCAFAHLIVFFICGIWPIYGTWLFDVHLLCVVHARVERSPGIMSGTWFLHTWTMTLSRAMTLYVRHDLFTCATWRIDIHLYVMCVHVSRVAPSQIVFVCRTWLTHWYVRHHFLTLIRMLCAHSGRALPRLSVFLCVGHDSFICGPSLVDTHSYVVCILCTQHMGWLRLVGSLKWWVSFAEYSLSYRALLQKRPMILRNLLLLIIATP